MTLNKSVLLLPIGTLLPYVTVPDQVQGLHNVVENMSHLANIRSVCIVVQGHVGALVVWPAEPDAWLAAAAAASLTGKK